VLPLSNTDEYEWVPCMRELLGSHCAILVYWYERTGCCERDMHQLPV
jgi:hypothetical protein